VIEKAYKKLRLDALVIQQGRLTEKNQGTKVGMLLDGTAATVAEHDLVLQPYVPRSVGHACSRCAMQQC
jgi:hypothetical protein